MFELVQKHKRIIMGLVILLIVPFAFFGLEAYTSNRTRADAESLASVEGQDITRREFSEAMREQLDQMRRAFGGQIDAALLDTPEARDALLDGLISQRLVATAAVRSRLMVTDESLRSVIAAMPAFQLAGAFSIEAYRNALRAQGLSEPQFESRLRYDLVLGQLTRAVADTAIVSRTVSARVAALENEQREVSTALIAAQAYVGDVTIDAAQVKAYYDANAARFRAPERVRVSYLVLSAEALGRATPPSEGELKTAYASRSSQFTVGEQRRASHILIQSPADAAPEAKAAARGRIEKILAELHAAPERFAELAKKHSQDPGSAAKNGDLGFFGAGMMVKPFEEAAFKLKEGELSGIVESEFGFHILKVTGRQPAKARPFEEVRKLLVDELAREKGQRKFAEAAEGFTNMVYEQSDTLKPAVEKFGLSLQTSDWLVRDRRPESGLFSNTRLHAAVFSKDALAEKRNTDAIEVAPNTLVAARVAEHQAARQRTLDETRADIEQILRLAEAMKRAQAEGEKQLARLTKGEDAGVRWTAPLQVSRRDPQGLDGASLSRVVAADPAKLPAHFGLLRPAQGYLLYRVAKVLPTPASNDEQKKAEVLRAQGRAAAVQYNAYVASLRTQADISINRENLAKKDP
ncbi:MAG: SurA N-terminal domain-containing protein [Proteobacteria bacterium]|nr:SurA N-terminal domain-containing protein [Pseudomonadota bacterium]